MAPARRWWLPLVLLAACECRAGGERENADVPAEASLGAPMLDSDWVRSDPPPDLLELTTEPYVIHASDPAKLRVERDGAPFHVFEQVGDLACASREGRLACSLTGDELRWVPVFEPDGTLHAVQVGASFFDDRRVEGPPRWTEDGALWIRLGDHWERRPVIAPAPPDRDAEAAAHARIRAALPRTAHAFEPVRGRAVPALWSEPLARDEAYALWEQLAVDGLARAVVTEELVHDAQRDGSWALRFAERVPVDAVLAQLETAHLAYLASYADELPEDHRYASQKMLARVRTGHRPPVPAFVDDSTEPVFPVASPQGAPQPRLRVLVVEGGDERLPIAAGFGGFNRCPGPGEHAVVLAEWGERYGARVRFMGRDALELLVADPPSDQRERYELGYRMLLFDPDLETVAAAARLARGHRWAFWWD